MQLGLAVDLAEIKRACLTSEDLKTEDKLITKSVFATRHPPRTQQQPRTECLHTFYVSVRNLARPARGSPTPFSSHARTHTQRKLTRSENYFLKMVKISQIRVVADQESATVTLLSSCKCSTEAVCSSPSTTTMQSRQAAARLGEPCFPQRRLQRAAI